MAAEATSPRGTFTSPAVVLLIAAALALAVATAGVVAGLAGAGVFTADTPDQAQRNVAGIPAEDVGAIISAGRTCAVLSSGLLAAQLQQESGFNPTAQSSAGAVGVAQFLPDTWKTYGVDGDGDGEENAIDPTDAIVAAARYDCSLAAAVASVPGDPVHLMLAAYNAGPGAVLAARGVPSYPETQNYVARIVAAAPAMTAALSAATVPAGAITPAARTAIVFAEQQLGDPYHWGATGPDAWDCSGLVQHAYATAGINLPRTTYDQAGHSGPSVPIKDVDQWQPGDLLFAAGSDGTPDNPGHVGIYLGNRQVLHAPQTGDVVKIVSLDHYPTVTGVTRPTALAPRS
jgi:cell wall-associated NlpC family hydrolase